MRMRARCLLAVFSVLAASAAGHGAEASDLDSISIVVYGHPGSGGFSGESSRADQGRCLGDRCVGEAKVSKVKAEMESTIGSLLEALPEGKAEESGLQLSEVELLLEVSANGGVSLVGWGEVGAKGGIRVLFRRSQ